jgi:hypothetical protein
MSKYGGGTAEQAYDKIKTRGKSIDAAVDKAAPKTTPKKATPAKPAKKAKPKKKKVYSDGASFGGPTQANKLSKNNAKRHAYK